MLGACSAPEAAPGSARPGLSRHVTGAARPSPSCAGPSNPSAMGDEDEEEGCEVELRITEGEPGAWPWLPRQQGGVRDWLGSFPTLCVQPI